MKLERLAAAGTISYPRPRFHPMTGVMVAAVYVAFGICVGVAIGAAMWGPK